jgi:hypothetical protein
MDQAHRAAGGRVTRAAAAVVRARPRRGVEGIAGVQRPVAAPDDVNEMNAFRPVHTPIVDGSRYTFRVSSSSLERPWWLLPSGRLNPVWWVPVTVILLVIDYRTAIYTEFPVGYVIPVAIAAWYSGRRSALALAVVNPVGHLAFQLLVWPQTGNLAILLIAATLRCAAICVLAFWLSRLSEHERELYRHVETLEGLLPICSFCKSIRNESGEWERLERYISKRSDAQFSHGFCPSCQKTHYPDL